MNFCIADISTHLLMLVAGFFLVKVFVVPMLSSDVAEAVPEAGVHGGPVPLQHHGKFEW
jgi:hypothetical protein